ncbi:MAG: hypothetical protein ABIT38_17610 [Gemmatimonadaceae bacterium]
MELSLRNWRPAHLLGAWVTYWAGLAAVKLGPGIAAIARVQGPNSHGTASAGFNDSVLSAQVLEGTTTVWHASAQLTTIALWVTVPPIVLWGLWMLMRLSRAGRDLPELRSSAEAPQLGKGSAEPIHPARRRHDVSATLRTPPDPAEGVSSGR